MTDTSSSSTETEAPATVMALCQTLNTLPALQPSKAVTGQTLKLHDAEMRILSSGPLGPKRLAAMRALDLMEKLPNISQEDAIKIGTGYVYFKIIGINGELTHSTQNEALRIESNKA